MEKVKIDQLVGPGWGETNSEGERQREEIGFGPETRPCEQEPSVKLGKIKEKYVIVTLHLFCQRGTKLCQTLV